MPDTFQALGVFAIALLPGALYVWSFERLVGAWGLGLSDRIFRFVGVSAIFQALASPLTYRLWVDYLQSRRFGRGSLPMILWLVPIAYVGIPVVPGSFVGFATRRGWGWAKFFTGEDPAPRAWDYLFGLRPDGWMRLRLKSGVWLGGAYALKDHRWRSYASGYPDKQDLFLVEAAEVDPHTGEFQFDDKGQPLVRDSGILIRWEEVEYLEFIDA